MAVSRIAIIGGGLGGLSLAVQLQQLGLKVNIFERDKSRYDRNEATFGISFRDDGLKILQRDVGLSFNGIARPNSGTFNIVNKYSTQMAYLGSDSKNKITDIHDNDDLEFNRAKLRDAMIDKLEENTILWNHEFSSFDIPNERLHFKPRHVVTSSNDKNDTCTNNEKGADIEISSKNYDLIIGCDGYKSKLRDILFNNVNWSKTKADLLIPQLTDTGLISFQNSIQHERLMDSMATASGDSGVDTIEFIDKHLQDGSLVILGNGCSLFMQRYNADIKDKSIAYYFTLNKNKIKTNDLSDDENERKRDISEYLLNYHMYDWNDQFKSIIANSDDNKWFERNVVSLSPLSLWPTHDKITLLGDAAHIMPPFQGAGGILALQDSKTFVDCLVKYNHNSKTHNNDNKVKFLKEFERKMMKRAIKECIFVEGACKEFHKQDNHENMPSAQYLGGQQGFGLKNQINGMTKLMYTIMQSEMKMQWNVRKNGNMKFFE